MAGEMTDKGNKRILVVEDDPLHAELLHRTLGARLSREYQVEFCQLAEEAMIRLQHQRFDLIVTDLCMSGVDGLDLIRHVRQVSPQTRTVLITAYPAPSVEDMVQQLAVTYLFKPFEIGKLVAAIEQALSGGEGTQ
jgi:CheY-like chemotaxis protein